MVSRWVAGSIVKESNSKARSKIFQRFAKIAEHLFLMGNFNTLMSIYCGLCNSHVIRCYPHWNGLSKYCQAIVYDLENLFSNDSNYYNYRRAWKFVKLPSIPYVGIHLRDLAIVEETIPNMLDNNIINFSKRVQTFKVINELLRTQSTPYRFHYVHQIAELLRLNDQKLLTDEDLHERALIIEIFLKNLLC